MEPETPTAVFLTRKKDYLNMIIANTAIVFALSTNTFLMIKKSPVLDFEFFSLIVLFLLLLYGMLQASIMLYEVAFYSDHICLTCVFLFFFRKTIAYKYEDIKIILIRPKYKVLTFYKRGLIRLGISTSLNRAWQKEQIIQMAQILDEHEVMIRNI